MAVEPSRRRRRSMAPPWNAEAVAHTEQDGAPCGCPVCVEQRRIDQERYELEREYRAQRQQQAEEQERRLREEQLKMRSCRFFMPPANVTQGEPPVDYPYNRAGIHPMCGNPDIHGGWAARLACSADATQCEGYDPDPYVEVKAMLIARGEQDPVGRLVLRHARFGPNAIRRYEVAMNNYRTGEEAVLQVVDVPEHGEESLKAAQSLFDMERRKLVGDGVTWKATDDPVVEKRQPDQRYIPLVTVTS